MPMVVPTMMITKPRP
jgi:hypothetical protein